MIFAKPEYLLALLLLPAVGLLMLWANKKRQQSLAKLGDSPLLKKLTTSINWRGRGWRNALQLFTLGLLIIALARPQWGSEVRQIDQEGLQVMVALDVSESMLAQDIKPNRLERAKLEIADLIVIQKADLPGADRLEQELKEQFNLPGFRKVPIVRVSTARKEGFDELCNAVLA